MSNSSSSEHELPSTAKTSCWTPGFVALLVTQFTVAMNDNVFRWLIIPIGKYLIEADTSRTLGAVFLLVPFLIFASIAGYTTDRFSRRTVMIWCKFVEMLLLAFGGIVICFMPGIAGELKIGLLLGTLFLLGTQSTFFSPSKYGVIPDLVPANQISYANGIIQMLTMIAIISGQLVGGFLFAWTTIFGETREQVIGEPGGANWMLTFGVLVGVALIGLIASFFIPKLKPVAPEAKFPINIFAQTFSDLKTLISYRSLFWVAIASAFFWGIAALAQTNIDKYASDYLFVKQEFVTIPLAILVLGIGFGSGVAGWISRGRIDLGMVPFAAMGIGIFAILLGFTPALPEGMIHGEGKITSHAFVYGSVCMMFLGLIAGFYDVPLSAYLQKNSPKEKRGRIIAAYNFFSFSFMLTFCGLFFVLARIFSFTGKSASLWIWICAGVITLIATAILLRALVVKFFAFLIRIYLLLVYRYEIIGEENIPEQGGVLMLSNHVSYLDPLFMYVCSTRPIRFFAHSDYIPRGLPSYLARKTGVMRIIPGKRSVVEAIKLARAGLKNGDVIGIFPEGGITRTGQIKEFEPGYTSFLKGNEDVPIVPVFLGGIFGSVFSYADRKRGFFSWPRKLRRKVIVQFGKPIPGDTPPHVVKHIIDEMAADAASRETGSNFVPVRQTLRSFKSKIFSNKPLLIDSMGIAMKPRDFLLRAFVAQRVIKREVLKDDEKSVAILAPPSVGGVVINYAVAMCRRVVINLNYTFNSDLLNYCMKLTETKHILSSKKVISRFNFEFDNEVICLEDIISKVRLSDKLLAAVYTFLLPSCLVERLLGLHKITADDTNTIVFTSGSTGLPKGVMLSNRGISENIDAFKYIVNLNSTDGILNVLPFFHAFGYTIGIWTPLIVALRGIYHYSPLEAKVIGRLAEQHRPTFMVSTATFLRTYIKRCPRENFDHLKSLICGAEKLPRDICDAWEEKYGVRPMEGYGTTELSPVVSTNIPKARHHDDFQPDAREGSIGRPIPNIAVKIVDVKTWEEMPTDTPGMLVIKGPNVMQGYYKQPELTALAIRDGWNITGDIAKIDKDGFVFITGRESRISKIGGEMVPHILIEEKLLEIYKKHQPQTIPDRQTAETPDEENDKTSIALVVASTPDLKKGERIVVLYTDLPVSAEQMCREMRETGCPVIWVPAPQNFYHIDSIPTLGSGKLDLAAIKKRVGEICVAHEEPQ